jgi:hypothetical protein
MAHKEIHMHFGKLADPNPRFRLFGAPASRLASVFGKGKGCPVDSQALGKMFPDPDPENCSMAVQLLRVRARSAPIQWCTLPR